MGVRLAVPVSVHWAAGVARALERGVAAEVARAQRGRCVELTDRGDHRGWG
jgi:hypothetical protein